MDVLGRIEQRTGTADFPNLTLMGTRHHLHQAAGADPADGTLFERRFNGDDGEDEFWIHVVALAVANRFTNDPLCPGFRDPILALDVVGKAGDFPLVGRLEFDGIGIGIGIGAEIGIDGRNDWVGLLATDCLRRLSQRCDRH